MFKVSPKHDYEIVREVYAVNREQFPGSLSVKNSFLVFVNGDWCWVDAELYIPYKGGKNGS